MMKLGVLTFHSQLNYGGVLQCWALKNVLERMGYEVVILDRWFDSGNTPLRVCFGRGWKAVVRYFIGVFLNPQRLQLFVRSFRTRGYLRKLSLSRRHFVDWHNIGGPINVDMIVVGSDQVWNCTWQDPGPFLLEGAPEIPAVAYAISLGMDEIPGFISDRYRVAANRFIGISARETSAVRALSSIGIKSVHVADPVMLCSVEDWMRLCGGRIQSEHVFCYLIDEYYQGSVECQKLKTVARRVRAPVCFYVNHMARDAGMRMFGDVKMKYAAGPIEFLKGIASAKIVITDSYHAVVFAIMLKKPLAVLRPRESARAGMFARIQELLELCGLGACIVDCVADAVGNARVCSRPYALEELIAYSKEWLTSKLNQSV